MKADIGAQGNLTVRAESELEAYALAQWADGYFRKRKSTSSLTISCAVERPSEPTVTEQNQP